MTAGMMHHRGAAKTTEEKLVILAKAILEVAEMGSIKPDHGVYQSVGFHLEPDLKKALAEISKDEIRFGSLDHPRKSF